MKVTRSINHHINMGNYESVDIGAVVEFEVDSFSDKDSLTEELDYLVADDLARAEQASVCEDTYVTTWRQDAKADSTTESSSGPVYPNDGRARDGGRRHARRGSARASAQSQD